jgi:hypothetical protein
MKVFSHNICWERRLGLVQKVKDRFLPKSEGDGYMLLAFVSREFGFGRLLTSDELGKINLERRSSGATNTDTHAAMEILGSINKAVLTESPFVKYLYIGVNNEGYWNSYLISIWVLSLGLWFFSHQSFTLSSLARESNIAGLTPKHFIDACHYHGSEGATTLSSS